MSRAWNMRQHEPVTEARFRSVNALEPPRQRLLLAIWTSTADLPSRRRRQSNSAWYPNPEGLETLQRTLAVLWRTGPL